MWSLFYNLAKIDSRRPFWRYISIVSLARAFTRLYANKIDYKCLKYAIFSNINLLMLENTFKLAEDAISKNQIIFKVFLEKILEFRLRYWIFSYKATFLLMPLLNYCPMKKRGGKRDLIWPINLCNFKKILILLAETIAN